jgi:hypothetical protein
VVWSGTILKTEIGMKKLIAINKTLLQGNALDYTQAYVGFKTNLVKALS